MKLPSISVLGVSGFALTLAACFSSKPLPKRVPPNSQPFPEDTTIRFTLSLADRELGLPERTHIDIPQSHLAFTRSFGAKIPVERRSALLDDLANDGKSEIVLEFEQPASFGHSASLHYYAIEAPQIPCSIHTGIDYVVSPSPFRFINRARVFYADCETKTLNDLMREDPHPR